MEGQRLTHITIVGGGGVAWLAAALLSDALNRRNDGPDTRITVIEPPATSGAVGPTALSDGAVFAGLGIDERDLLRRCDATFSGAVRFRGWDSWADGTEGDFYRLLDPPAAIGGVDPAHHYHRRNRRGAKQPPLAHAMSALPWLMDAARAPRPAGGADYEGFARYGFHLEAARLGDCLRGYCTALGVQHLRDEVIDVAFDSRGFVAALALRRRGAFPVELVIDCTGRSGLILRRAMDEPFVPEGHLPCDRVLAVTVPYETGVPLAPYTTATALSAGWSWRVPLYSRLGAGYAYSSRFASDEQAEEELRRHLGPAASGAEAQAFPLETGRLRRVWVGNVVAVGEAAGAVEPLDATALDLARIAVQRLIEHLPDRRMSPAPIERYNRSMGALYDEVRDFTAMHYAASHRPGAFWQAARRDSAAPERVTQRLALWRHKLPGPADLDAADPLFAPWSYICVLYGKRFFDGVVFPIECAISDDDYDEFRVAMETARRAVMTEAPDHRALLDRVHAEPSQPWYEAAPPARRPAAHG